jgi:hypothetical protein
MSGTSIPCRLTNHELDRVNVYASALRLLEDLSLICDDNPLLLTDR